MDLKEISVLYVEDEAITRMYFARMLSKRVKTVHLAIDGRDGLEKVAETTPDIIITDINMPVMDGREMIHHLRVKGVTTPVIAITAYEYTKDELKVSDVIRKPVNIERLITCMKTLV